MTEIVIVGAGVLGLSSAFAISENYSRSHKITVVAEFDPDSTPYSSKYTSPWAGAHFRPFPSKNAAELKDYPLSRVTLARFKKLAQTNPELSIKFVKGVEYFGNPDNFYRQVSEGYKEGIDNFKVLEQSELPSDVVMGTSYQTYVMNLPHYLQFLYRRLKFHYGVNFVNAKLAKLSDAVKFAKLDRVIVVNCTGMGLQWDGGYDPASFPIRGQTLLVRAPQDCELQDFTITHQLKDGEWTFCIPRPLDGGIILGGTKQINATDSEPRDEDTKALLQRGAAKFPQLMKTDENGQKYFDVAKINVGFRPARHGGMNFDVENHGNVKVINAYGAGGSGYEFSYGVGFKVYELLLQLQAKL